MDPETETVVQEDRPDHQKQIDRLSPAVKHQAPKQQHRIAKPSGADVIKNKNDRQKRK